MKLKHDRLIEIENFLSKSNLDLSYSHDLISTIYENLYLNTKQSTTISVKRREKIVEYHLDSIKRDLLKIKYKKNNCSSKNILEGYVYVISNPAWPGRFKIGSTIDVVDRLNSYQTYSPNRDYILNKYFFSPNRLRDEKEFINTGLNIKNEWITLDIGSITKYCNNKRDLYRTPIKPEWIEQL